MHSGAKRSMAVGKEFAGYITDCSWKPLPTNHPKKGVGCGSAMPVVIPVAGV